MLQVSDAYKELVKSNIRPKCEPIIKVSGIDNEGNDIELIWQAKNIKDLKYKRAIDPVGRELPYMELTWTEIYTGKFDAENYPEKYNNVVKYMQVELLFVQDLAFHNTWKTIFDAGTQWGDFFWKNAKWKDVKNKVLQETIKFPTMFLTARPTINGKTITWNARDFLCFCDKTIKDATAGITEIPFFNALRPMGDGYTSARYNTLFSASNQTWRNFSRMQEVRGETLNKRIFVDTVFSDFFLNYLKLKNYVIYFDENGSVNCKNIDSITQFGDVNIDRKIMYSLPKLTKEQGVCNYLFVYTDVNLMESQNYEVEYSYKYDDIDTYVFEFNGFGEVQSQFNPNISVFNDANGLMAYSDSPEKLVVTPFSFTQREDIKFIKDIGADFNEINKINPFKYSQSGEYIDKKAVFLDKFFNENNYIIKCETLPMLMLEPLDVVYIDRGMSQEEQKKQSIVVDIEISYNGALRQKITAHECDVGFG